MWFYKNKLNKYNKTEQIHGYREQTSGYQREGAKQVKGIKSYKVLGIK